METEDVEEKVESAGNKRFNRSDDSSKKSHLIIYSFIKVGVVIAAAVGNSVWYI